MIDTITLRRTVLTLALSLSLAACTQPPSPPPPPQTGGMSGIGGHQGHDMSGMNLQQMMAHCAQMRQQMRPGAAMSPDMQAMMAQCDQMSQQQGTASGAGQHRH